MTDFQDSSVIVGKVACDYLRITTFAEDLFTNLTGLFLMFNQHADLRQMKLMQYHGKKGVDGMFVGQEYTEQGAFKHGLYQVSGRVAHTAMEIIRTKPTSGLKATRVDLQITVLHSSARAMFDAVWANRATLKGKQGNKLRYKTIEGDDGLNTIYVGSRVSEVFRRIYVKEIDGELYIRFECELKGKRADEVLQSDMTQEVLNFAFREAFNFLVSSGLPEHYTTLSRMVGRGIGYEVDGTVRDIVNEKWIRTVILPYLKRAIHFDRNLVEAFVDELYKALQTSDDQLEMEYVRYGLQAIAHRGYNPDGTSVQYW
jgi:hypothetical protein